MPTPKLLLALLPVASIFKYKFIVMMIINAVNLQDNKGSE